MAEHVIRSLNPLLDPDPNNKKKNSNGTNSANLDDLNNMENHTKKDDRAKKRVFQSFFNRNK
jgi:hypothetical protein